MILIALGRKASSKDFIRPGDVMVDSLLSAINVISSKSNIVKGLNLKPGSNFAMMVHRADNTGDSAKLYRLLRALGKLNVLVILPVHPQTNKIFDRAYLMDGISGNFRLIDSLKYIDLIALIANAYGVLTDSGGIQKESYVLGTRWIPPRQKTEWLEIIVEGRNSLIGLHGEKIVRVMELLLMRSVPQLRPFGSVGASECIVDIIDCGRG